MEDVVAGRADIESLEQIEDALMVIKSVQHEIEFLKRLKQHRVRAIEDSVNRQESRIEILKQSITKCMVSKKEKTLNFPDLAKVTLRKTKGTWEIKDDRSLAEHLKSLNKFDEVGEEVIKYNKTKLNKVLNELETFNNTSDAVGRMPEKDGLSVSFHESEVPVESINDLLPLPLPKPAIPSSISIIPNKQIDLSDDIADLRF